MKENKYDDAAFYEKYCQMPRSVQGLEAAGEWHALRALLPPLQDKRVLDLGCGLGWHCRYAAEQGAASVTGVDLSQNMLREAEKRTPQTCVRYERSAMEDFPFQPEAYDVVISSLALHYVPCFAALCVKVRDTLTAGGDFVFSVEHPVFTAQGEQQWHCGPQGELLHWPVDSYFTEGQRQTNFLGEPVKKYHRTLTTYVSGLLDAGFALRALVEPMPEPHMLDSIEGMRDELRRPMMLLLAAQKA